MSDVLLIDGNPDHVRPLVGLFKYRVPHDLEVVGDCVSGLRRIYTNPPDAVLINALLFASENYGFPQALREASLQTSMRVIVLVSGRLDEIRERAAQQYGATILELPTSAGEIAEAIEKAPVMPSFTDTPEVVTWSPANEKPEQNGSSDADVVRPVSWSSIDSKPKDDGVRAVDWGRDGGSGNSKPRPRRPAKPARPQDEAREGQKPEAFRPSSFQDGGGFRPTSPSVGEAEETPSNEKPEPFRPSTFGRLDDVDPSDAKNR